jgi:hypothetical protein
VAGESGRGSAAEKKAQAASAYHGREGARLVTRPDVVNAGGAPKGAPFAVSAAGVWPEYERTPRADLAADGRNYRMPAPAVIGYKQDFDLTA